jgi:PH (Pleckstrin Homology) domain-containing protein
MNQQAITVTARPIVSARLARITAAVVLVVFIVIALVMTHANAGATFGPKDQVGTGVLGVLIASGFLLLTRPRLVADSTSVRMRSYVGGYRTVPWDVIVAVEFPAKVRFARVVLPGEETLALYAVQRLDKEQAVTVMRALRQLLAASRSTNP